jgi:nucleotide-binding universal stress UspA family protein
MKTILAPTDFSASSINAVNYAADMAMAVGAQLVLFNAVQFPIAVSEISVPDRMMDDLIEMGNQDLEELTNSMKERTHNKISIASEVLFGPVEQQIELMSAKNKPLAIVMGIKPGKSFERALMGSTIFHTINYVSHPVLIIPEDVRFSAIREIGLACDLKNINDVMPFDNIREWLSLFKARLHIIYVSVKNKTFKAEQLSESISIQNQLMSFNPQFHFLEAQNLTDELNYFSKLHALDLLIVMPRTYGIFKAFHQSHSKKLICRIQIPVLSIHDLPAHR